MRYETIVLFTSRGAPREDVWEPEEDLEQSNW